MNCRLKSHALIAAFVLAASLMATDARARTIEVPGSAFDRAAVLDSRAPDLSWAGVSGGRYAPTYSSGGLHATPGKALLLRYDLQGVIPEGMRITRALWVLPVMDHSPSRVRLEVWRMIADWGPGVSHELRTTFPEPQPWGEPGGRAHGVDRALSATASVTVDDNIELSVNVTRDLELWQSGAAPNHGWMITVDDDGGMVALPSPISTSRDNWKLRITYEPE